GLSGAFGTSGAVLILGTGLLLLTYFLVRNYLGAIASSVTKLLAGAVKALMILSLWFSKLGGKALSMLCLNLPKAFWRSYREYRERRAEQRAQELEVLRLALKNDSSRNRRRDERPAPQPEPFRESRIVVVDHSKPLESLSQAQTEPREIEPREKFEDFIFPSTELLQPAKQSSRKVGEEELLACSAVIQEKLLDFNIPGQITHVHPGPVITMYEFEPAAGIKLGKITALQDDLAMALKAQSVRIIAPLPERGSVGIEVPNEDHQMVMLRELLEYDSNPGETLRLPIPLGKDTFGAPVTAYIADMPHLLLAGATGTGKSVCINAVLMSLLYKLHPSELQMILIDPKILELSVYEGIPHLKVPVVTDPRKAKAVLQWAVQEMDHRYRTLKKYGVRNIDAYNDLVSGKTPPDQVSGKGDEHRIIIEELEPLPKILIVIDELADLMLTSGREVEELITRLAQKARAAGIHLLLATQRPSVDVITGLIKANFPARVSFRVSSRIDSRTILDTMGAERLLGKGDMLFLRPGAHHLKRVHGAFVSDQEVRKVTSFLRESCKPEYDGEIMEMCEKALEDSGSSLEPGEADTSDPLYDKAVQFVLERGQASTSMIQRTFRIGYNRAARIVDTMEQEGLVGPMDGAKPRAVIVPHASGGE
ncbi:MAG: hypothetical protein KDD70_05320, partial [Bdellovibrionales bacterium]|nr:hypothetical protein [Bdellovibrionales bacterium]